MQKVTTPITEAHGCRRKSKAPILKLKLCSLIILHYMAIMHGYFTVDQNVPLSVIVSPFIS